MKNNKTTPANCYTMAEAAVKLGVGKSRVSQFVKDGRLKPIRRMNRYYFRKRQIDSFKRNPSGHAF